MAVVLLRRLAASLLLLLVVLTATFFVVHLAPGDPATLFEGERVSAEQRQALRRAWGLDRPLPERYVRWLGAVVLRFDWGVSLSRGERVSEVVARHLPPTVLLAGTALLIQFSVGLALGVGAARRPGSFVDHLIRVASTLLYATPSFWLGLMALLCLSHLWPLFPAGQMRSLDADRLGAGARLLDLLRHLALPAAVLGLATAGAVGRFARASLLEVLNQEFIRAARAKGLGEGKVLWVHALRNALSPMLQLLGLSLPILFSGALVIEVVFAWPGMGRLVHRAILMRDYPVLLATTALTAMLVVAGNLAADLAHAAADPRTRDGA